jgi:hypothetical protein
MFNADKILQSDSVSQNDITKLTLFFHYMTRSFIVLVAMSAMYLQIVTLSAHVISLSPFFLFSVRCLENNLIK